MRKQRWSAGDQDAVAALERSISRQSFLKVGVEKTQKAPMLVLSIKNLQSFRRSLDLMMTCIVPKLAIRLQAIMHLWSCAQSDGSMPLAYQRDLYSTRNPAAVKINWALIFSLLVLSVAVSTPACFRCWSPASNMARPNPLF